MNKKAVNAWHELKWFYRFMVLLFSIALVYIVLYSAFNFSFEKKILGETFTDKVLLSNVFVPEVGVSKNNYNVIYCENFNVDSVLKQFYFNSVFSSSSSEDIIKISSYSSPIVSEFKLTYKKDEKNTVEEMFFYPNEDEFKFLQNSYLNGKNVAFIEKNYIVNVFCEKNFYKGILNTKTYVVLK